jgi:hypothetical protein
MQSILTSFPWEQPANTKGLYHAVGVCIQRWQGEEIR